MKAAQAQRPNRATNPALMFGLMLTGLVFFVAVFGQSLAPRDPGEFTPVLDLGDRFVSPPFPAFVTAESVLGSDQFGRDTLSRLLYAIQPTLLLALGLSAVRVLLGAMIGIISGWSTGRLARMLDGLTSAALIVPLFIVALAVVAALQNRFGAIAFVIGLTLTGWAEVARYTAEQTRLIKNEKYIEASHALGQPGWRVLLLHVWRQLVPSLRLFLVLEIAAVLLALASLAYLGYFYGGANWVMVTDFNAQRVAGLPELTEVVASAVQMRNAEQMAISGSVLVLLVLTFVLLGEGLRAQLALERRRRSAAVRVLGDFVQGQQDRLAEALSQRRSRQRLAIGATALALAVAGGLTVRGLVSNRPQPAVLTPAGALWASERRDPPGTLRIAQTLPATAPKLKWMFEAKDRLSGGPAVASDGTVYLATATPELLALNPDGTQRWAVALTAKPLGAVAINADGSILVADEDGGVSAFDATGKPGFRYTPATPRRPLSGPVTDSAGNAVLALDGEMVMIDRAGQEQWRVRTPYSFFSPVPRLTERFVFFKDLVVGMRSGQVLVKESREDLDQFITGFDGNLYLISNTDLVAWQSTDEGASLSRLARLTWTREFPGRSPADGTVWQNGDIWVFVGNAFGAGRVIWLDASGNVVQAYTPDSVGLRWIGIDASGLQVICGEVNLSSIRCEGVRPREDAAAWTIDLESNAAVDFSRGTTLATGGALTADRIYVSTEGTRFFALGWD
jgi:peptide/nickel transport system permease protein